MFYAKFIINGHEHAELYFNYDKYFSFTFSPDTRVVELIEFITHGKSYQDRKASLHDIAVQWSNADSSGLYLDELCDIDDWFFRMGKRYGLREEFKENLIGY